MQTQEIPKSDRIFRPIGDLRRVHAVTVHGQAALAAITIMATLPGAVCERGTLTPSLIALFPAGA